MTFLALLLAVACVAFTNGANANFKGVASLYGSGTTTLRTALYWGTVCTFLGSLVSAFMTEGIVKAFGGRGIIDDAVVQQWNFILAVAVGAAATSFIATRCGFPVSTTHALVGALCGCGVVATLSNPKLSVLNDIRWGSAAQSFSLPLIISPILSAIIAVVAWQIARRFGFQTSSRSRVVDFFHFFSTGAASFARGMNDTPKVVALLIAGGIDLGVWGFLLVGLLIAVGAIVDADNVAETLGKKIVDINPAEGLVASVVTAGLVSTANLNSLPVSTTHVSVGALAGIGVANGKIHWHMLQEIILAWITTFPCGSIIAGVTYFLLDVLFSK